MVKTIIAINIGVFVLWNFSNDATLQFMFENFLVSWTGLLEGKFWTLLGSAFSHNSLLHLLVNMYAFYGFGVILETILGRKSFIVFYLTAGVVSSLAHSLVCAYVLNAPDLPALGASGAIAGTILLFSLLFPREKILLLGFIPIRAIFGAFLFIGLDIWGLIAQSEGGGLPIGHGAHLGGSLCGIVYYFYLRRARASQAATEVIITTDD